MMSTGITELATRAGAAAFGMNLVILQLTVNKPKASKLYKPEIAACAEKEETVLSLIICR